MSYHTERREETGRWLPALTQTIRGAETMAPFFMSVASPSNHWLFLSSLGSLTAGRRSPDAALFPYRTVDQIHDAVGRVGGRTLVRRPGEDGAVWEPFTERSAGLAPVTRTISRSAWGTSVTLTERNEMFGLEVRQTWTTSHERGVLRFVEFEAVGEAAVDVEVIDGVLDVLPASVDPNMQARLSSLVAAYRMAEISDEVAIFRLGSIPLDRAEPNEALLCTTAWSTARGKRLLSEGQFDAFRRGEEVRPEQRSRGTRGALLVARALRLGPGESDGSAIALEVDQAADDVEALQAWLRAVPDALQALRDDAQHTAEALVELLASADGLQRTAAFPEDARHYANTLYNAMRGGLPIADYRAPDLGEAASPDAFRRAIENLPLGFSRRHGDPSRPWNRFAIDVRGEDGELKAAYEGNWRDIFQNWEALGVAFPKLLPGFIARFLNASTADGYNPYRIDSLEGVDWEIEDPDDPWSHIGYWGDHQIVYLTRLIERLGERYPDALEAWIGAQVFVHADVPYRIAGFDGLVADPRHSVAFDPTVEVLVREREARGMGPDARLLHDGRGELVRSTLEEKLLVPVLVKLVSFVPGAGVWMNTQRPEWNDANNALAGYGASIVTTAALWRHVGVLERLLQGRDGLVGKRTADLLAAVTGALVSHAEGMGAAEPRAAALRFQYLEAAGRAGERHRKAVYAGEDHGAVTVAAHSIAAFCQAARDVLAATLGVARRSDDLFHTYFLLRFTPSTIEVGELPLMLEGQAAVLSSGFLGPAEALGVARALEASPLYRADLGTYLLYPDRDLPSLLDLGRIDPETAESHPLVRELLRRGHRGIVRASSVGDPSGGAPHPVRFAPPMRSASCLADALAKLPEDFQALVEEHRDSLLAVYEDSFGHASFLGRSGSFFGYEGLGCTYWHMVSKLALAVQDCALSAADAGRSGEAAQLLAHYRAVREGIGANRSPERYGAFPSEPYSHSPADGRVRQPGMTGQVKEDLLARLAEVGLRVDGGRIRFDPTCVVAAEFATEPCAFPLPAGRSVAIPAGAFGFTHCGTPVVVHKDELPGASPESSRGLLVRSDGRTEAFDPVAGLDADASRAVFERTGEVARIEVALGLGA